MAKIWVKAGTVDKVNKKPFDIPLCFKCQGHRTDNDTPIQVNADGNVTSKIRDGSLLTCRPPYFKEQKKETTNVK